MKIVAKKSLGQNFLKSKVALSKMLEAGEVNSEDIILEVGPGKGVLTEKLLEKAKKVIAVEKDDRLIELLQEKFQKEISEGRLEIVHSDILDFDPRHNLTPALSLTKERGKKDLLPSSDEEGLGAVDIKYKIIANIPYYITGIFLRKFLETKIQPAKIVVMVQKEVADRIVAKESKENLLSLSIKVFGDPKKVMKVDKENFSPAPKVDSAILLINNISKEFFIKNSISEKDFFDVLHAGFAHKRKMLLGNLKEWFKKEGKNSEKLAETFQKNKISEKTRAEDLPLQDWVILIKNLP